MKTASITAIFRCLHEASVRYIVVGGLAVIEHGFLRQTKDVDLVIELEPDNIERGLLALESLGYSPRVPVTARQFADPALREKWKHEKQMLVLNLYSDSHLETPVDVFVTHPFDFAAEFDAAILETVDHVPVRFVSLPTPFAAQRRSWAPARFDRYRESPPAGGSTMKPEWKLPPAAKDWEATWEASRRFQIRHWAALPFERKLAALEEMNDYARAAQLRHAARAQHQTNSAA